MKYLLILIPILCSCNPDKFEVKNGNSTHTVSYKLPAPFSAQSGTASDDQIFLSAADTQGNIYFSGTTKGNLGEASGGSDDIFVQKVNSTGTVVWTKQIGATTIAAYNTANATAYSAAGSDYARGIVVDSQGNAIVVGCTYGSLAGTNAGGSDAVFFKLNSLTGDVVQMKQFGTETEAGTYNFDANDCGALGDIMDQPTLAIDSSNNIYMTTNTFGSINEAGTADDIYVTKLNSSFSIQWLKQMGTASVAALVGTYTAAGGQFAVGIELDSSGHPMIGGYGTGYNPALAQGLHDLLWFKLHKDTGAIQWVNQIGGPNWEVATAATLDIVDGHFLVGGYAGSDNLWGDGEDSAGWDSFVFKVNASTGNIIWGKTLGTNASVDYSKNFAGNDFLQDIVVHPNGKIYAVGATAGNVSEVNAGGADAWIAEFNHTTGALVNFTQYGSVSYLGPSAPVGADQINTISNGVEGNLYFGGMTTGTFLDTNSGAADLWYVGFNPETGSP